MILFIILFIITHAMGYINQLKEFNELVISGHTKPFESPLYTGVDLGTADIILAVIDNKGRPVAGMMRWASALRDGLIYDYVATREMVFEMKKELEERLHQDLKYAGAAFPPGTEKSNSESCKYVCMDAGFLDACLSDEPSAAAVFLGIDDGVVVDIGGGTTGISVLNDKKVIYSADEATGGTHISLVIAGNRKITYDNAEKLKLQYEEHSKILGIVKPVIEKMADIVEKHIRDYKLKKIFLVGGTRALTGFKEIFGERFPEMQIIRPEHSIYVTPLGIASSARNFFRDETIEKAEGY